MNTGIHMIRDGRQVSMQASTQEFFYKRLWSLIRSVGNNEVIFTAIVHGHRIRDERSSTTCWPFLDRELFVLPLVHSSMIDCLLVCLFNLRLGLLGQRRTEKRRAKKSSLLLRKGKAGELLRSWTLEPDCQDLGAQKLCCLFQPSKAQFPYHQKGYELNELIHGKGFQ